MWFQRFDFSGDQRSLAEQRLDFLSPLHGAPEMFFGKALSLHQLPTVEAKFLLCWSSLDHLPARGTWGVRRPQIQMPLLPQLDKACWRKFSQQWKDRSISFSLIPPSRFCELRKKKKQWFHSETETDKWRCHSWTKMYTLKIFQRWDKEKPFYLWDMQKGFYQNSNLQTHLLIHSREKAVSCEVCNKGLKYVSRKLLFFFVVVLQTLKIFKDFNCYNVWNIWSVYF